MTKPTALVTGANKGIGKEVARGLGRRGFTVLAAARDPERGARSAAELAAEGLDIRFIQLDVTDEQSIAEAVRQLDRLDVLINNAGITNDLNATPSETEVAAMREVYETNVLGVVAVTNAVLPLLKQAPAGRIVNVASQLGSLTLQAASELPTYLAYGSSKSALNAITVQYARELAGTSVRVNACSPGKCATDLNGFTSDRTPAQGARIIVDMATVDDRHGVYVTEDGPIPW